MQAPFATSLAAVPWLQTKGSRRILDALSADGHPVRFVGGCVRDGLLGCLDPDGDLDLATPARPDRIIALLKNAGIKVIPTGLKHGTVTAICGGTIFEITTLREDIACDGRHAEVRFTDDFALDAARRDFTINAMSVDRDGRLYDYFDGRDDLAQGRLRFVGEADQRVKEDYLRILRFFRFFAAYGRPPADPDALSACRRGIAGIESLSGERIRTEMLKLLGADDPIAALNLMIEAGVLGTVLPTSPAPDLTILSRLLTVEPSADALRRLASLLRSSSASQETTSSVASRWRLSNKDRTRLSMLLLERKVSVSSTIKKGRQDLYRLGPDDYLDLIYLSAAENDAKAENLENAKGLALSWTSPTFPLRGQDLIDHGLKPGQAIGDLLGRIEKWWLDQDMQPDREACLAELKRRTRKKYL